MYFDGFDAARAQMASVNTAMNYLNSQRDMAISITKSVPINNSIQISYEKYLAEREGLINQVKEITSPKHYLSNFSFSNVPALDHNYFNIDVIKINLPQINIQTDLFNSISQELTRTINKQQASVIQVFREISSTMNLISEFNMRTIIYNASTIPIDKEMDEDTLNILEKYKTAIITVSPYIVHYFIGSVVFAFIFIQIVSDPSGFSLLLFLLQRIYESDSLIKDDKEK
ncbi:hypothetical protein [Salinicoccus halodurans]|uniref:Uncharacterized protein n=1 Tax=Salinicoccus halodurans TaxID=407035 RepID=A0A0F7HM13_9STAP|nr:hypothetical protein [Salinicoccus halodurans]AKG74418.1 hypothetical protein AAT16_09415 [Salinicoccus halodurans]SFK95794.1 hypothetical protein SAMN05216235_2780 [Salinicoccus halodurans]